jgi:processive 1,2-diacylglycerol beta-glucosyltransferase
MSAPRIILVCSAAFGEGHNTAARNLCAALDELGAGRFEARFTDVFAQRHPEAYEWFRKGYVTLMNSAPRAWAAMYQLFDKAPATVGGNVGAMFLTVRQHFTDLLDETWPAAVISTYPFYGYLLNDIARRGGPADFLRVMVVTDSISINSIWHRCETDFFCVPNEDTAAAMRRAGVPGEKLCVLGFPVGLRFAELDKLPARPGPTGDARVLYMINAGKRAAPETVRRLLALENISLTVTVGRDENVRAMVEKLVAEQKARGGGAKAQIIGWTRDVPELLASHHLIISKAGGATTQEAIAARCPMIISQIAPGQEEGNAQLLIENGAGCLALSPERIAATVQEAFVDNARLYLQWAANIAKLSRPDAARDNARFILEQIDTRQAVSAKG